MCKYCKKKQEKTKEEVREKEEGPRKVRIAQKNNKKVDLITKSLI